MDDTACLPASGSHPQRETHGLDRPLLADRGGRQRVARLREAATDTFDRMLQVERAAMPSLHWLQGTLGSGIMAGALFYGALGGGTNAEEGLARTAVVLGSHWYVGGVRELLAAALSPGETAEGRQTTAAAAAAIGAWVGLMAGTALLGSPFRPAQYAGLAVYHTAVMVASSSLRHSYQLESRRGAATDGRTLGRNTSWAIGCAAVIACASVAGGGTFWLTSRGSSVGALAAGTAGFHAIVGACRAMGLMQARALPDLRRRPTTPAAAQV